MPRVFMYSIHKSSHMLWTHVRIEAVTQVGNIVLRAKPFQHLLHQLPNLLLRKAEKN